MAHNALRFPCSGSLVLANFDLRAPYEEAGCDWGVAVRWILSGIVLLLYCVPPYAAVAKVRALVGVVLRALKRLCLAS